MNLQKRADYREAPVCAGASFSLGHAHKNVRCQGAKRPSLTLSRSVFALLELRCLLALVILMRLVDCVSAATLSGKADIVDGDTIKVGGIAVRLDGIDAFETEQTCEQAGKSYACGKEATKTLASLISGRVVQCEVARKDKYDRSLGECSVAGTELSRAMVREGWALAFVKYSNRYVADEKAAKAAKAGAWAGSFMKPWDWRLREYEEAQKQVPSGCVIKGNINKNGERIYHMPFQQAYKRTRIDPKKGERWFCTEEEALKRGWRRALR
jgi:endonuclease YncB( thermonuclease family)